ncbi:hypothetical protein DMI69_03665 [Escherichia coli]|nr:hypothetical protein [Escherichia coli]
MVDLSPTRNERCDLGHELLFITQITCNALTDNEYFKISISVLFRMLRFSRSNSVVLHNSIHRKGE